MKTAPKDDPVRELCKLCRAGKLFAVDDWCKAGKPIEPTVFHRLFWPMGIAIETGFHSLVELLLRHDAPPDARTLYEAVRKSRTEIVQLLFDYGADAKGVSFEDVILRSNFQITEMFVERGADLRTGYPLAKALIRFPSPPLVSLCKRLFKDDPELRFQASVALRYLCETSDKRGVSLMLRMAANPRTKVPLHPEYDHTPWETSFHSAFVQGDLHLVRMLGFDPARDNPTEAFWIAAFSGNLEVFKFLFENGANPNQPIEGCTAFDTMFWKLRSKLDEAGASLNTLSCLNGLMEMGVKWIPTTEAQIDEFRRCLFRMSPQYAYELIKKMKKAAFCSEEVFIALLDTPRMRKHLACRANALVQIFPFFATKLARRNDVN